MHQVFWEELVSNMDKIQIISFLKKCSPNFTGLFSLSVSKTRRCNKHNSVEVIWQGLDKLVQLHSFPGV